MLCIDPLFLEGARDPNMEHSSFRLSGGQLTVSDHGKASYSRSELIDPTNDMASEEQLGWS